MYECQTCGQTVNGLNAARVVRERENIERAELRKQLREEWKMNNA